VKRRRTPAERRTRARHRKRFLLSFLGFFALSGLYWTLASTGFGALAGWAPWVRGFASFWSTFVLMALTGIGWGLLVGRRHPDLFDTFNQAFLRIARGDYSVTISMDGVDADGPGAQFHTMAQNLNSMATSLARVEELRRQFVADVSHEFQSPLTSIQGFAQALQTADLAPEDRSRYLGIIEAEARRLSRLADGLLKLNALEDRSGPPDPAPFRLDVQLRRVLVTLEPQWSAKALEVEADLSEQVVVGNEELWTRVWTNLIHNAVKFTPAGGRLSVRLRAGPPLVVEVSDTGCGLTADQSARVFERFYKAEAARSNADGAAGSGLGLALVKRIAELHGAEVAALSPGLGQGTTLRVTWPGALVDPGPGPGRVLEADGDDGPQDEGSSHPLPRS